MSSILSLMNMSYSQCASSKLKNYLLDVLDLLTKGARMYIMGGAADKMEDPRVAMPTTTPRLSQLSPTG
jgi:hypothetical protein